MNTNDAVHDFRVDDSQSDSGKKQRKYPRFPIELTCSYSLDDGISSDGTVVNLSRGGSSINGVMLVQPGQYLRILIFPAIGMTPIEIGLAPVRWANGNQFGVEFIKISSRDGKRLQSYLTFLEVE